MTDRDLLEAAAKAAGITGEWMSCAPRAVPQECVAKGIGPSLWNPLTDDGDALRLAVRLGIDLHTRAMDEGSDPASAAVYDDANDGYGPAATVEPHGTDPNAATRRAIVRAAAAMGAA